MNDYMVIADMGTHITGLFREMLVPDLISHPDKIYLGNPTENPQAALSIYLYDIKKDSNVTALGMIDKGMNRQRYPSMYLALYYMITAISVSDIKYRALEEQKILGRVMQIMQDVGVMEKRRDGSIKSKWPNGMLVSLLELEMDEKLKIYQSFGQSYKPSLFYRITPVELHSAQERDIHRIYQFNLDYGVK